MNLLCLLLISTGTPWKIALSDHDIFFASPSVETAKGNLVLIEWRDGKFHVFDNTGKLLNSNGGQGEGPQEFKRIAGSGWDGTHIWVIDAGNNKILYYDEAGVYQSQKPWTHRVSHPRTIGDIMVYTENGLGYSDVKPALMLLRGEETQALWRHDGPSIVFKQSSSSGGSVVLPWTPRVVYATGKTYVVLNYADNHLRFLDLKGTELAKVPAQVPQMPLDEESIEDALSGYDPSWRPKVDETTEKPDFWPAVVKLIVDSQERTWVFGRKSGDHHPYSIFDKQGSLQKQGKAKRIPAMIGADYAIYTYPNEDDDFVLERGDKP